jgi:predicted secreted acid phosphatase
MAHATTGKAFRRLARSMLLAACVAATAGCAHAPAHDHAADASLPNLGLVKAKLLDYGKNDYANDLARAAAAAEKYVVTRAPQVANPALVLDIDETSLSNYAQLVANDFGYIKKGGCQFLPEGPCGTLSWDELGHATAIAPTLQLFDAAQRAGAKVFFVTGRREAERKWTEANLAAAGYRGWQQLVMKPDALDATAAVYKTAVRADIESNGYTIIANVGDQQSDLDGGHAERIFKLPNPFYFIN